MNAATIVRSLKRAKFSNDGWMACCPAHNDRNPSLSIKDADNGKVLVHCFAGCDQEAVIGALKSKGIWGDGIGKTPLEPALAEEKVPVPTPILPVPASAPVPNFQHRKHGHPSETWKYNDVEGRLLGHVCRFDLDDGNKEIIPFTYCELPNGRQEWRWKAFGVPRPLYGLDLLAMSPNKPVIVTEGEKAADAGAGTFPDHVVVTSPGGSKAADKADWSVLKDRIVTIWPDNDEAGKRYAEDVAGLAVEAGANIVTVVQMPDNFPDKWDLADKVPDGRDSIDLEKLLSEATNPPSPDTTEITLAELASLSLINYDQVRAEMAEALEIRVATLDNEVAERRSTNASENGQAIFSNIEPWETTVNGSELLDEIRDAYRKYMILPDGADTASALWVLFAHAHDAATISPILAINSPEKRCGKTTHLSVTQHLVPRPLTTANITAAGIFRSIEKWSPVLLVDEADTFVHDNNELRGVLNSGHNRNNAFVIRCTGDNNEPERFFTWCPKAIALIGKLPDTLADRSIAISLRRKLPGETVDRFRFDRTEELTILARKAARWADDNLEVLSASDPDMPAGLHDRAADNWRPLLAIADQVRGDWPEMARKIALALSGGEETEDNSEGVTLLADIWNIFTQEGVKKVETSRLLEFLVEMEERPWPEFRRGQPITARQMAKLLQPFGIKPREQWIAGTNKRGYDKSDFEDSWSRYLDMGGQDTTHASASPLDTRKPADLVTGPSVRLESDLAHKIQLKPANNNDPSELASPHPSRTGQDGIPDLNDDDGEYEDVLF